jgi:uncharacterized protein (TIGR02421 family)
MHDRERHAALLARIAPMMEASVDRRTRLLDAITWPRHVEERFFARGARELPEVHYEVDRDAIDERVRTLVALGNTVDGDDAVAQWVRSNLQSVIDANRMVRALGTQEFYRLSREIYGGARTRFHGTGERNIDLADHLLERLKVHGYDETHDHEHTPLDAEELAQELRDHAARRYPAMELSVTLDDDLTAKVIAGTSRVRVRAGATFHRWEADGLWHHEVETHVLTAQNGAEQRHVPFLRAGGPRTTRTQEGLAVFAEMYHHCLATPRMERLALRVKLVEMAESGADFLDLYHFLRERGSAERDAYLDAKRICRGGRVEGGAPFTKDAAYLAGLLDVRAFLSVVVRGGFRDELELLIAGRIDLDDLTALVILRREGLLERPRFVPAWLRRWTTLVPEFAFSSFLSDLTMDALRAHYHSLIEVASAQVPTTDH